MPTFEKTICWKQSCGGSCGSIFPLVTVSGTTLWVFHKSMLPLYELLHWLDSYAPGREVAPVPNDTSITEFRRLNVAAQQAVDRSEELFERQNSL